MAATRLTAVDIYRDLSFCGRSIRLPLYSVLASQLLWMGSP